MNIVFNGDKSNMKVYIGDKIFFSADMKKCGDKFVDFVIYYILNTTEYQVQDILYKKISIYIGFISKFENGEVVWLQTDGAERVLRDVFEEMFDDLVKNGAQKYYGINRKKEAVIKNNGNKSISIHNYVYYINITLKEKNYVE